MACALLFAGCVAKTNNLTDLQNLDAIEPGYSRIYLSGSYANVYYGLTSDTSEEMSRDHLLSAKPKGHVTNDFKFHYFQLNGEKLSPLYTTQGRLHTVSYYVDVPAGNNELVLAAAQISSFYKLQSDLGYIKLNTVENHSYQIVGGVAGANIFSWKWGFNDITLNNEDALYCEKLRLDVINNPDVNYFEIMETKFGFNSKLKACEMIVTAFPLPAADEKLIKWTLKKNEKLINDLNKEGK